MPRVRVVLAEDSPTVRNRLREILAGDPDIELVGEAADGRRAIELCSETRPDVVSLDMMLPIVDGLAVTEYVMGHLPTPILIVSASVNRGEVFRTFDALAAGAVRVLEKPNGEIDGAWERDYLATLKLVSRIRVITHPRARLAARARAAAPALPPTPVPAPAGTSPAVVAVGASTGGPSALAEVLRHLPADLSVPVLVVLHISAAFANGFAEWLAGQIARRVTFARDRELLRAAAGSVLLAPPDVHLVLSGERLSLVNAPERHSCRPSVDVLFESLAANGAGRNAVACLLTGMGRDGAAGLLAIRRAGGTTAAQDEASSVIYGMPREAVLLGAAQHVLPLDRIGPWLGTLLAAERRSAP